jgi:hypothetical protein
MTVYILEDGRRLKARRSRELVEMLRAESWIGRGGNSQEWMQDAAARAEATTGHHVRSNNEINFVRDLIKTGLIRKESP